MFLWGIILSDLTLICDCNPPYTLISSPVKSIDEQTFQMTTCDVGDNLKILDFSWIHSLILTNFIYTPYILFDKIHLSSLAIYWKFPESIIYKQKKKKFARV